MPFTASWKPPRRDARPLVAAAARAAQHEMAQHLIDVSRPNVPWETKRLAESGTVIDTETGSYSSYGFDDGDGKNAPTNQYAVIQHESKDFYHPNGGGPDWLRNARDSEGEMLLKVAAVELEKVFR